jgi:maleylacetate reductase
MIRFQHDTHPQRICFGSGEAAEVLTREVAAHGTRAMVIAAEPEMELARQLTGRLPVVIYHHDVVMHVPVEVAERARATATSHAVDLIVSVGGGSTTGLAKAVALTTGLPIICAPTTYAGSEATNVWGLTDGARKTTGTDPRVLPRVIVYDAELTLTLPIEMSVASGMNALAHCVDAMWAPRADPINAAFALEGMRGLRLGLPAVKTDPLSLTGREMVLWAAYLAAASFASAGSGLHHKICHVLGGAFNLPHAQTHAIVLPYVLAFNAAAVPEVERSIARSLDGDTALSGLLELRDALDAPVRLSDYGFRSEDVSVAARAVGDAPPAANPRPVSVEAVEQLLHAARTGADPTTVTR